MIILEDPMNTQPEDMIDYARAAWLQPVKPTMTTAIESCSTSRICTDSAREYGAHGVVNCRESSGSDRQ